MLWRGGVDGGEYAVPKQTEAGVVLCCRLDETRDRFPSAVW